MVCDSALKLKNEIIDLHARHNPSDRNQKPRKIIIASIYVMIPITSYFIPPNLFDNLKLLLFLIDSRLVVVALKIFDFFDISLKCLKTSIN